MSRWSSAQAGSGGRHGGRFRPAGAQVAVVDLRPEAGEARAHSIRQAGGRAALLSGRRLEKGSLAGGPRPIQTALGPPTILLNAAGGNDPKVTVTPEHPFETIPLEDWQREFRSEPGRRASSCPARNSARPWCARGKGSIINIASVSAHIPLSRVVAYSAAKAAVLSLTQFLAREWATQGRARELHHARAFFPAEQNRKLLFNDDGSPTDAHQAIWGHTPMDRFGEAQELVGAAIFLASAKASGFVTGADIRVDGGFLCQTI